MSCPTYSVFSLYFIQYLGHEALVDAAIVRHVLHAILVTIVAAAYSNSRQTNEHHQEYTFKRL